MVDKNFYQGKNVLITGHTGFKGTWMCKVLTEFGAKVTGYALEEPTVPGIFSLSGCRNEINSIYGDVRDLEKLEKVFGDTQPEIVIHLAAQPIVRESYKNPVDTYTTNVIGTVNVLEAIRKSDSVRSFVNVTTDKVYFNKEWEWGYRENEELNGYDPYSNSKSCSELVTSCYRNSFLKERGIAITTARAGNVIGGGDFAVDRIIPDCVRAIESGKKILIRNPYSIRPYQHVLEPVMAYLMLAQKQYDDISYEGSYNVGPKEDDCITTGVLVEMFCQKWNAGGKNLIEWEMQGDGGPHEAQYLKLDCSKISNIMGWTPKWNISVAVDKVVEWTRAYLDGENIGNCMVSQIAEYQKE